MMASNMTWNINGWDRKPGKCPCGHDLEIGEEVSKCHTCGWSGKTSIIDTWVKPLESQATIPVYRGD